MNVTGVGAERPLFLTRDCCNLNPLVPQLRGQKTTAVLIIESATDPGKKLQNWGKDGGSIKLGKAGPPVESAAIL